MPPTQILIVDDETLIAEEIRDRVEKLGHTVLGVVDSANAAFDILERDTPDVILMDIHLKGNSNGVETASIIAERWGIPIIFLTGQLEPMEMDQVLATRPYGYLGKPIREAELSMAIQTAIQHHAREQLLERRVEELREAKEQAIAEQQKLKEYATRDALTGLWNRRMILQLLEQERDRADREWNHLVIMVMDIDHFKTINDTHGHAVGDWVLREVTNRIVQTLRPYDLTGRFGGEEFLAILPIQERESAKAIGNRVRLAVGTTPIVVDELLLEVTLSVGMIVIEPNDQDESQQLIALADKALYQAKHAGRNRVAIAIPEAASAS